MKSMHSKQFYYDLLIPILLLAINLIIKALFLGNGSLGGDEPFTVFYSQADFSTFAAMMQDENNPPLYFILLHFWIKLFGISVVSVRILPLIFSSLTVVFIYKLGQKFLNVRVALLASLLFTFSNFHTFFAHETRVYPLFTLLTTISMYSFLSLAGNKGGRKHFISLLFSNTLLIYSHFLGFFVILAQVIAVVFIRDFRKAILKKYCFICLLTFVLYLPYLRLLISRFSTFNDKGTWVPSPTPEDLYTNLWKFSNAPVNTVVFILLMVTALILLILNRKKISGIPSGNIKVILIWFLVPYLLIFLISLVTPMFLDRYLIFISIGYYLVIAVSIHFIGSGKNWIFYPLSVMAVFLMLFTYNPRTGDERNTQELVNTIRQWKTGKTAVYLCPEWIDKGFVYYYNTEYFKDYKNTRTRLNTDHVFPINSAHQVNDTLLLNCESAIYLDGWSVQVDPENMIYRKLAGAFRKVECNENFHGYKIYHFSR